MQGMGRLKFGVACLMVLGAMEPGASNPRNRGRQIGRAIDSANGELGNLHNSGLGLIRLDRIRNLPSRYRDVTGIDPQGLTLEISRLTDAIVNQTRVMNILIDVTMDEAANIRDSVQASRELAASSNYSRVFLVISSIVEVLALIGAIVGLVYYCNAHLYHHRLDDTINQVNANLVQLNTNVSFRGLSMDGAGPHTDQPEDDVPVPADASHTV